MYPWKSSISLAICLVWASLNCPCQGRRLQWTGAKPRSRSHHGDLPLSAPHTDRLRHAQPGQSKPTQQKGDHASQPQSKGEVDTQLFKAIELLPVAAAYLSTAPHGFRRNSRQRRSVIASVAAAESINDRKNPALYAATSASGLSGTSVLPLPLNRPPTLLAPAGGWPQLHAAVNSGADAVYFGVRENFNARARAANFGIDELPEVMAYLQAHNVRGYCTVNVLIFDKELPKLETLLRALASAGVDALIVQDVGAIRLVRELAPNLPVHASTQMSITSAEGAEFARNLGCERVVVGRELSTKEIAAVAQNTGAEIEAFVHGAMCVSYSGQCFSSESWGGRSANRGQCAQACRLPYGLLVNGSLAHIGDIQYLLSPQDMAGLAHVPKLIRAGVHCFKVEGRLKGPEYVAMTTTAYRQAIDHAWHVLTNDPAASDDTAALPVERLLSLGSNLAQIFARGQDEHSSGLSPGFLDGSRHQRLVRGRSPGHRGLLLGTVAKVNVKKGIVTVALHTTDNVHDQQEALTAGLRVAPQSLKCGDGVVFDSSFVDAYGIADQVEQGGQIYDVSEVLDGHLDIMFGRVGSVPDLKKVHIGDKIWRNSDAALERTLRRAASRPIAASAAQAARDSMDDGGSSAQDSSLAAGAPPPAAAVHMRVRGGLGAPLRIQIEDNEGRVGEAVSKAFIQQARSSPLTSQALKAAAGALGGDGLVLETYDDEDLPFQIEGGLFMSTKEIKATRRAAVEELLSLRQSHDKAQNMVTENVLPTVLKATVNAAASADVSVDSTSDQGNTAAGVEFSVLCRTPQHVEAAVQVPWLKEVAVDFLEVHGLQKAVQTIKAAGKRVVVATPRILKPDEERLWKFYLRLGADALLVRSTGLLHKLLSLGGNGASVSTSTKELQVPALHGDFSLNAVNAISAGSFLASGIARLTPGHDASCKQIVQLAEALGPINARRMEVVVHQHLPVFHTEHCVFCRFLSEGNNYTNCGHPCENNQVHLRDSSERDHLVLADMGCRNTVFNAQAQSAVDLMPQLLEAGVQHFRIELVDEPSFFVKPLLDAYARVAADPDQAGEVWEWLQTVPDANGKAQGVTLGSLDDKEEKSYGKLKLTKTRERAEQIASSRVQQSKSTKGSLKPKLGKSLRRKTKVKKVVR